MNTAEYLKRIKYSGGIAAEYTALALLHQHHVFHVPFENLDIQYGNRFDIEPGNVYRKVVLNGRGGFCYELNSLFNALLRELGFKSKIISAKIIDDSGNTGPDYDHMVVCVEVNNKSYLADVGYGDLFLKPLEISETIQHDGRNYFKLMISGHDEFILLMSADAVSFQKKYVFQLNEVRLDHFRAICLDKQTNPASYFVKNVVCTKPTETGRITVFNDKLIEKKGDTRIEELIPHDEGLRSLLKEKFGLVIRDS